MSNEAPTRFVTASDQEFVARAAEVGSDGIRPLCRVFFLPYVDVIPVKQPSLMTVYRVCFELSCYNLSTMNCMTVISQKTYGLEKGRYSGASVLWEVVGCRLLEG